MTAWEDAPQDAMDPLDRAEFLSRLQVIRHKIAAGRIPRAAKALQSLRQQQPDNLAVITHRAYVYLRRGANEDAERAGRRALERYPTRPESLHFCGVVSPAFWWDNQYMITQVDSYQGLKKDLLLYLDCGTIDDGQTLTELMRDILIEKGYVMGEDLHYVLGEGHEHNEAYWAIRAPDALHFLLADPDRVQP